jgi:hypothetical protein
MIRHFIPVESFFATQATEDETHTHGVQLAVPVQREHVFVYVAAVAGIVAAQHVVAAPHHESGRVLTLIKCRLARRRRLFKNIWQI